MGGNVSEQSCERRVLQMSYESGERFEVWAEPRGRVQVFGEDSQGPITEQAYGEAWHRSMVEVETESLSRAFVNDTPEGLLARSDAPLCDLMDLLDLRGVAYRYLSFGSNGVVSYRGEQENNGFFADA